MSFGLLSRMSPDQILVLNGYFNIDPLLINDEFNTRAEAHVSRKRWKAIAKTLNSLPGERMAWRMWRHTWKNVVMRNNNAAILETHRTRQPHTEPRASSSRSTGSDSPGPSTHANFSANVSVVIDYRDVFADSPPMVREEEVTTSSILTHSLLADEPTPSLNNTGIPERNQRRMAISNSLSTAARLLKWKKSARKLAVIKNQRMALKAKYIEDKLKLLAAENIALKRIAETFDRNFIF